jgi:hypothetical protein
MSSNNNVGKVINMFVDISPIDDSLMKNPYNAGTRYADVYKEGFIAGFFAKCPYSINDLCLAAIWYEGKLEALELMNERRKNSWKE